MPAAEYRIISIGTLPGHPLWNERSAVRTGHATTTLVSCAGRHLLIDPGLPPAALAARLAERTPVRLEEITDVFMTSFTADHHRGLPLLENARWLLHEPERLAARAMLEDELDRAEAGGDREIVQAVQGVLDRLGRCRDADDQPIPGVSLFPLPGVTPGACGVLLPLPAETVLITGDAVATVEHLAKAAVLPHCADHEQAMESLKEAIEIADTLVPGRDNVVVNPARRRMG